MNKKGIDDVTSRLRTIVNGHTVQTNLSNDSLIKFMREEADDTALFVFCNNIDEYEIKLNYVRSIHSQYIGLVYLFLRRGLDDLERKHYSEEIKQDYVRQYDNKQSKGRLNIPEGIKKVFSR